MKKIPTSLVNRHSGSSFNHLVREVSLFAFLAIALYMLLCLLSYSASDPGWSHSGEPQQIHNLGGRFGAWVTDFVLNGFGRISYLMPLMVAWLGWRIFSTSASSAKATINNRIITVAGLFLTIFAGCGLESLHYITPQTVPYTGGGLIGNAIANWFSSSLGRVGASILLVTALLAGITFLTGLSWFGLMDRIGLYTHRLFSWLQYHFSTVADKAVGARARKQRVDTVKLIRQRLDKKKPPRIEPKVKVWADSGRIEKEKQSNLFETATMDSSVIPPLSLLEPPTASEEGYSDESLKVISRLLEKKLADFNVDVEVVAVNPGPVITRFEIAPAPGVKASQIVGLANDLARALSAVSVRVVENIPGKSVIGIEVPNESRETVRLVEGLSARNYEEANTPLALVLGKDISGVPVVVDLCKMPHLLIAGTTGSGKSVCINALILSIIYKSSPQDVRLIMVDPKMLELSIYDGIPHLLAPVVTDMKEAANALRWGIVEMERRYRYMAALGVRNITGYNRKVDAANKSGKPIEDPLVDDPEQAEALIHLPYIVVVIDELADLMMVVGKKVEQLITRLAQKGRASGLHLVLATQRPSVDVITGLIKANIPTRISFQVSSRVDSRTVLDQMGAEQLLGHGDMLYLPPGTSLPVRVHGCFVSDQEVHRVVKHLKKFGKPIYQEDVLSGPASTEGLLPTMLGEGDETSEDDPLYDQAVALVTQTRRASISAVQRALRVGYNRAARMVDIMESTGVVGPLESNGKREVLAPPPPKE